MTSTTAATESDEQQGPIEEHYYRRGDIDFCFMLNRTHRNLRVFDYRVGNYQQKRDFFDRIARAENLKKVFTVVEKQDSKSWRSVGFSREGAIPGYFRTADAYVMSRVYTEDGDPIQGGAPKVNAPNVPLETIEPEAPKGISVELIDDEARLAKVVKQYGESMLYAPFRRQTYRPDLAVRGKVGKRQFWIGAELDRSFGHVKIDIFTIPTKDGDADVLRYCLKVFLDHLREQEMASVFSMIPVDETGSAGVFASRKFRVTARLTDHLTRKGELRSLQFWHRRISAPAGPRMASFI